MGGKTKYTITQEKGHGQKKGGKPLVSKLKENIEEEEKE